MPLTNESSEVAWITAAQAGDADAFRQLVEMHQQAVIDYLYRMGNEMETAQDLAQETFLKAWLSLPKYRPEGKFRNWLLRIAHNAALDFWRRERPTTALEHVSLADDAPGPEHQAFHREVSEMVQRAVQSLPPGCRAALILREYHQLSYREIAETLEIPTGTVMSRLNYARTQLKKILHPLLEKTYA